MTHAKYLRAWRAERKAAGFCRDCRAPLKVWESVRCSTHREANAEQERKRYHRIPREERIAVDAERRLAYRQRRDAARAAVLAALRAP